MRICLTLMMSLITGSSIAAERGIDLPLYYDVRSGDVTIDFRDVTGGRLSGYEFAIPFLGLVNAEYTPFMNAPWITATTSIVGETNFNGVEPNVYSLGRIMPSGLTKNEFESYFDGLYNPYGGFSHEALGTLGSAIQHRFSPQYQPSPFPAMNDPNGGRLELDWAEELILTYDQTTGELALDGRGENGGHFMSYVIQFREPTVDLTTYRPFISDDFTGSSSQLAETSITPVPPGIYSLGAVLEPGLTADQLTSAIAHADFLGEPQRGTNPLDLNLHGTPMAIRVVPEPAAGAVLLFTFLAWVVSMRRTRLTT